MDQQEFRVIPGALATELHPDKVFRLRDSYREEQFRVMRKTKKSIISPVRAIFALDRTLDFPSLTRCAAHFNVDRSTIMGRIDNGRTLDGWTFSQLPL